MNEQDAFLEAILQEPDNLELRQIFADWLEERCDPRGELIRVQCSLAALPEGDERRAELEIRQRTLLAQHETEWAGPLRDLVLSWQFRNGFVEQVTVDTPVFLERGEEILQLAPVREVSFRAV